MDYQTKAAIKSAGVVGPLVAFTVQILNVFGIDVSAELVGVTQAVGHMIDNGVILIGAAVGVYGRIRANKRITGIFKAS